MLPKRYYRWTGPPCRIFATARRIQHVSASSAEPISPPSSPPTERASDPGPLFLEILLARYRQWAAPRDAPIQNPELENTLMSLELAAAACRLAREPATRPLQIAVLGPTQTGKSTVVNLMLAGPFAEVSPLAGFTVHAHGFALGCDIKAAWAENLFPGWPRAEAGALPRENLHAYTLRETPTPSIADASDAVPCVVWDTPDFDSLGAPQYRRSVLEIAALADVLVFVVSKEKYSDLSVWNMLSLVAPLGRRLILCINKLTPDAAAAIVAAVRTRLSERTPALVHMPIITVPYRPTLSPTDLASTEQSAELWKAIAATGAERATPRNAGVAALIEKHWDDWTAPIRAQAAAEQQWHDCIAASIEAAATAYRNEYLEHPQRYDTFRRATIELLDLLEIPVVGGVLGKVRGVVTWPARQLFAAGREWFQKSSNAIPRRGSEEAVLEDLFERILTAALRDAVRAAGREPETVGFWQALTDRIEREQGRLRTHFAAQSQRVRADFEPEVHATANRLYELLRERPALLAGFRAARATADVASIALAIKTGGAHLNDLLLAPATFAMSSFLAEGALGGYMGRVAADLKRRQFEHIRRNYFEDTIAAALRDLAATLNDERLFGISLAQARSSREALNQWKARNEQ